MTIITPAPIATLPTPPVKGQAGFNTACETYFNALVNPFTPQVNAAIAATNANALDAQSSAVSAQLSAATANAGMWVSGSYATGAAVWSPVSLATGTPSVYIRKEPGGASPTDPTNDPTNWVRYVPTNTASGAVYTTSTTLTSSSPFAISISGGSGVWLKLPDATILPAGIRHVVRNTGENDLTVLDSTGAVIGFIRPQCGTTIALSDSSTAAGKWVGDFEQIGVTADFQFGASVAGLQNVKQIIQLDAVRTMVITGGSNGQGLWAVVYDTATQTTGAPVMIRAAAYGAMAVKSSTDQVLCVAFDNGNPGNLYATVLTISGSSITVNTAVTAAITGQFTGAGNWVAVGGAFCLGYNNGSYGVARAITISGTTPSIGAEQSAATSDAPRLYVSGAMLRAVRISSFSTVTCTPYTVIGNTLTAGTAASTTTAIYNFSVRSFQFGSGDICVLHASGGYWVSSIFKLTSTTESVLSSNINALGTLGAQSINIYYYDYAVVDSSKIAFICAVNASLDSSRIANIVNTNGSPVVSQVIDVQIAPQSLAEIKTSISGEVGFAANDGNILVYFDCAGAYPVKTRQFLISGKYSGIPIHVSKNTIGIYSPSIILNAKSVVSIIANTGNSYFTPIYSIDSFGLKIPFKVLPILRQTPSVRGENNQSAFCVMAINGTNGVALQRIQLAQV